VRLARQKGLGKGENTSSLLEEGCLWWPGLLTEKKKKVLFAEMPRREVRRQGLEKKKQNAGNSREVPRKEVGVKDHRERVGNLQSDGKGSRRCADGGKRGEQANVLFQKAGIDGVFLNRRQGTRPP